MVRKNKYRLRWVCPSRRRNFVTLCSHYQMHKLGTINNPILVPRVLTLVFTVLASPLPPSRRHSNLNLDSWDNHNNTLSLLIQTLPPLPRRHNSNSNSNNNGLLPILPILHLSRLITPRLQTSTYNTPTEARPPRRIQVQWSLARLVSLEFRVPRTRMVFSFAHR